jgi:hypothetical protein
MMIASTSLCAAQEMLPIERSGVTAIEVTVNKTKVKVTLHTVMTGRSN